LFATLDCVFILYPFVSFLNITNFNISMWQEYVKEVVKISFF
jgi:hypothetical protein